jgi:hypothetical protein
MNVATTILDIIHLPLSYLKHNVSETGVCLRLQVDATQSTELLPVSGTEQVPSEDGDRIQSPKMDNAQNCDRYINIPPSHTYRSYSHRRFVLLKGGQCKFFEFVANIICFPNH